MTFDVSLYVDPAIAARIALLAAIRDDVTPSDALHEDFDAWFEAYRRAEHSTWRVCSAEVKVGLD